MSNILDSLWSKTMIYCNEEFAVSGGRSGDNPNGPLFINPITL